MKNVAGQSLGEITERCFQFVVLGLEEHEKGEGVEMSKPVSPVCHNKKHF